MEVINWKVWPKEESNLAGAEVVFAVLEMVRMKMNVSIQLEYYLSKLSNETFPMICMEPPMKGL